MNSLTTSGPALECDLVMKGGITSGVIYLKLISTLSNTYRFRSIGGTSAGASAAAAAAAAQLGVHARTNADAFKLIERLSEQLGGASRARPAPCCSTCFSRRGVWRDISCCLPQRSTRDQAVHDSGG